MTADAPARDREAELAAIWPVALAGVEIEPAPRSQATARSSSAWPMAKMRSDWPEKSWPSSFGVAVNSNCRARSQAWPRREPPR
ncbi:hypothetical protein V6L77_26065 [Pannonibacter sp. Pt2-lr]